MHKILLFVFCSFFFLSSDAQRFKGELQFGIVGSQVSGDELSGFNKAGICAGAGVSTELKNKFGVGFRILYLQKGSRKPSKLDQGDPSYYLLRLNYIEIPVLLHYQIGKRLYAEAGPSFGYLVKHSEQDENGELYNRNSFSDFDLSICGALAYPLGTHWRLKFEAWQSILPVREHGDGVTYRLNQGQYNTVIGLGIQYLLLPAHQ